MSILDELKDYLLGKDGDIGYLLDDNNNGKTVMFSGAWGSGKTHFWQNEIERVQHVIDVDGNKENKYTDEKYEEGLSFKLNHKEKSCVYISLYGKDSLSELKKEVLFRASTEDDYLSDDIEAFGFNALSTIEEVGGAIAAVYKVASNMNESRRDNKGTNKLKDGGLICFDDFERKSKNIDLNDLFGFISQLAINLNCKMVIILNSDVFKGEEANVFKTVKEKTVNKFFYFEPTRRELFDSIYDRKDNKYVDLDAYREDIFNAIDETEELNARIYIQVLDNCLEWIDKGYDSSVLGELVLCTVFFIKNHLTLNYTLKEEYKAYDVSEIFLKEGFVQVSNMLNNNDDFKYFSDKKFVSESISIIFQSINNHEVDGRKNIPEDFYQKQNEIVNNNKEMIRDFVNYVYRLNVDKDIERNLFVQMNDFIKTGILLKNNEESK